MHRGDAQKWAMGPPPEVIVSCAGILDIDKAAGNPKCLAGGRHFVRPDTVRTVSASKRVVTDDRPPQYVRPEMLAPGTSDWSQIGARRWLCYVPGVDKRTGPFLSVYSSSVVLVFHACSWSHSDIIHPFQAQTPHF